MKRSAKLLLCRLVYGFRQARHFARRGLLVKDAFRPGALQDGCGFAQQIRALFPGTLGDVGPNILDGGLYGGADVAVAGPGFQALLVTLDPGLDPCQPVPPCDPFGEFGKAVLDTTRSEMSKKYTAPGC